MIVYREKNMSKTIGVLVIDIEGAYSKMIWPEVARYAKNNGYDIIVLPAYNPEYPYYYLSQNNSLYNFINSKVIDALIVIPSFFSNFISPAEASQLLKRIQKAVPVVTLNTVLENSPCLLIDNKSGIKKAVTHFVNHHGYKRIGFICGPPKNEEALERKEAFIEAMTNCGIPPEEEWFFPGDFTADTAIALAQERGPEMVKQLDGIICANDYTATGLINSLQDLGYSIPEDLSVIGFDDINEAPFLNPPLTTIKQPFKAMAQRATQYCIDLCEKRELPIRTRFESDLIIRSSCGCENYLLDEVITSKAPPSSLDQSYHEVISEELNNLLNTTVAKRLLPPITALFDFLVTQEPTEKNRKVFLRNLEALISQELFTYHLFPNWQDIFTIIVDLYISMNQPELKDWLLLTVFERARYLISKRQKLWKGYQDLQFQEHYTLPLRSAQQNMAMVQSQQGMVTALKEVLPELGIKNCYISLLKKGEKKRGLYSSLARDSKLIMAYVHGEDKESVSVDTPLVFPTLELVPGELKNEPDGKIFIVSPLYNRENLYGFLITDAPDFSGFVNESIRHQLSVSLHSCFINNQREQAETKLRELLEDLKKNNIKLQKESLNDEMTGLLNRRGFLKEVQTILDIHKSEEARFALFFADMDGLKEINDSLGHAEGDLAIKDMAIILTAVFREEDSIARLGGDEFTIFTMDVPDNFEQIIQNRLNKYLKDHYERKKRQFVLSISFGCILGSTNTPKLLLNNLMAAADEKLYKQKREKKNNNNP